MKMQIGYSGVLLLLLFSVVLVGFATAEDENESFQKIRAAPDKNIKGNVVDGTGTESSISFDDNENERKSGGSKVSVSTIALFTLAMSAATGLGAVPFFFLELDPQWAGLCNGIAAGVMLAASFDLVQEGQDHGGGSWVVVGTTYQKD